METELSLQPIVETTAQGMSAWLEYGVLGSVAVVALGFAVIVSWILVNQAKACFEGTKTVVENNTNAIRDLDKGQRESSHGIQLILARLEAKIDAK